MSRPIVTAVSMVIAMGILSDRGGAQILAPLPGSAYSDHVRSWYFTQKPARPVIPRWHSNRGSRLPALGTRERTITLEQLEAAKRSRDVDDPKRSFQSTLDALEQMQPGNKELVADVLDFVRKESREAAHGHAQTHNSKTPPDQLDDELRKCIVNIVLADLFRPEPDCAATQKILDTELRELLDDLLKLIRSDVKAFHRR